MVLSRIPVSEREDRKAFDTEIRFVLDLSKRFKYNHMIILQERI